MYQISLTNFVHFFVYGLLLGAFWLSGANELGSLAAQQERATRELETQLGQAPAAVPRRDFFAIEGLPEGTRRLSEDLLLKALDSEAFYTLVGQLKPVSEGFWGGYFSVDPGDLAEIEQVREALRAWHVPEHFFADVLVYEPTTSRQRYVSAYVVHLPSLKQVIAREQVFFARWGITPETPAAEVMLAIERSRQPDDRWRGFGLVFGYPPSAIDFFVQAGMHQRSTGEFVERDFRQIATFASRSGRFVYAVPKLSPPTPEDLELQRRAAQLIGEYRRLRAQYVQPTSQASRLLQDWMDDVQGSCHPAHLWSKLPEKSPADIAEEIASWSAAENKPPEIKLNHVSVVLSESDFEALRNSGFITQEFAAADQGMPNFAPVEGNCHVIYLRGQDTYLEFWGPANPLGAPVGKVGLGWSVENVGELDAVEKLLAKNSPDTFTRKSKQWETVASGSVNWYQALIRNDSATADSAWWFSETHGDFLPTLYALEPASDPRISRRDFLAPYFDHQRIFKNITTLALQLPFESARSLRSDLETLGWRTEEFDTRTWILKGSEFRLMVHVADSHTNARLMSLGFDVNAPERAIPSQNLSQGLRLDFDGRRAGWILFK